MGKNKNNLSRITGRMRGWIQAGATLLSNIHLSNFFKGGIYQGGGKAVCVPGLNCYSCPAASGACPIGAFQAVAGSSKFGFSYYITGFLILVGVLLGRFVCGFLCPFGWLQDLLHKVPGRKISTGRLKPLTYMKYAVLIGTVILLPALMINDVGMGDPYFCKYICPQGVLEGALPLAAVLMLSLAACSGKSSNSKEPSNLDEAVAMYQELMEQENQIFAKNKKLWEKVFMEADKGMTLQEDGKNYGEFLLDTIESAKEKFTEDELKTLKSGAEEIKNLLREVKEFFS